MKLIAKLEDSSGLRSQHLQFAPMFRCWVLNTFFPNTLPLLRPSRIETVRGSRRLDAKIWGTLEI
jgi:hypothetical protein